MHRTESINFDWKYAPEFRQEFVQPDFDDTGWEDVHIPNTNVELPYNNFPQEAYQFESCYRKTFSAPELTDDEALFVRFEELWPSRGFI